MLDKLKFDISGDDFREGLTAISVKVAEPQFEGQTKRNRNREVVSPVSQAVSDLKIIWKKIQMMLVSFQKSNSCSNASRS
jgi:DNA gyrase/topoisomerase IV subunit B